MVLGALPCLVGTMPWKAYLLRMTRQFAYANELGVWWDRLGKKGSGLTSA